MIADFTSIAPPGKPFLLRGLAALLGLWTLLPAAHADAVYTAPVDLLLSSVNVSGHLVADAGRDLTTSGINLATGNGSLTAGRSAAIGDLTIHQRLAVSAGQDLSVVQSVVSGLSTAMNSGGALQLSGALSTGTSLTLSAGSDMAANRASLTAGTQLGVSAGRTLALSGSVVSAGQAITLQAGANGAITSSSFTAGTDIGITAGTELNLSGNLQATRSFSAAAANDFQLSGHVSTGRGTDLSAGGTLTIGAAMFEGVVTATGGTTLAIAGPVSANSHASFSAGVSLAVDSTLDAEGSLAMTAPDELKVAHQVTSSRLAVTTDHLRFMIDAPSTYGAFDVAGQAAFDGLQGVVVAFSNSFDFADGQQFDLIIAGSLQGVNESLFSIENLDPFFRYVLAIDTDSVRLSLIAADAHGVPEPAALPLLLAAFTAAGRARAGVVRQRR